MIKRLIFTVFIFIIILGWTNCSNANSSFAYKSLLTLNKEEVNSNNQAYQYGIANDISNINYWKNLLQNKDNSFNYDSYSMPVNASVEILYNNGYMANIYIDGQYIDQQVIINNFENAKNKSTYFDGSSRMDKVYYAVVVKNSNLKLWPTNKIVKSSLENNNDLIYIHSLNINDPVIIRDVCNIDGNYFYYCTSEYGSGWIDSNNIAIFDNKEEWLKSWKVNINDSDFLVVVDKIITLEKCDNVDNQANIELSLGTRLKLVPNNELPESNNNDLYLNYAVIIPARDYNGKYIKQYALVSVKYNVIIGRMDLTNNYTFININSNNTYNITNNITNSNNNDNRQISNTNNNNNNNNANYNTENNPNSTPVIVKKIYTTNTKKSGVISDTTIIITLIIMFIVLYSIIKILKIIYHF